MLRHRLEHAQLFQTGAYVPLTAVGPLADHALAFARRDATHEAVVLVPRLTSRLARTPQGGMDWRGTTLELQAGRYRSLLTGEVFDGAAPLPLDRLLARFPVALLVAAAT